MQQDNKNTNKMNDKTVKFSKYKDKGLTGLANLGNTCFLNSTIQCLSHTYEFNEFLEKKTYKDKLTRKPDSLLLVEWDKLREMIWSENCTISPGGFVGNVQKVAKLKEKDIFTGWAQNDLPEFLLFIIDAFHNAISREVEMNIKGDPENDTDNMAIACFTMMKNMYKKEFSEILQLFYGIHVSLIKDLNDEVLSMSPEPFFMIDLPIPTITSKNADISLGDCFSLYVQNEKMMGENAWFNDKTNQKQDVNKQITFWSLPQIMVITLKRFTNQNKKNNTVVTFPLEGLDLSNFVKGYNSESYIYDLYGICNHLGGPMGGHYTSFVKNMNHKWYHYNDTNVTEVKSSSLDSLIGSQAYCFFYRKR